MKYYISSVRNDHNNIKLISNELNRIGHICIYNWWDTDKNNKRDNYEIAFNKVQAIEATELYICLMPFSRNTATEFGLALGSRCGKRIIIWSNNPNDFDNDFMNTYMMHPSVSLMSCSMNKFLEYLKTL